MQTRNDVGEEDVMANLTQDSASGDVCKDFTDLAEPLGIVDMSKGEANGIAQYTKVKKRFGGRHLKYRIIKTGCLVMTWVCIGFFTEMTGPTFKDLEQRLNLPPVEATEAVSRATSGRSLGFLVGAVIGGFLVDRFKRKGDLFIGLGLLCAAAVTIGVPWMTTFATMFFLMLCQGTFEGIINVAGQEIILLLWGEKSAGPMHILHFGFGMGSFLNPLIAQPFLATRVVTNNTAFDNFTTHDSAFTSPGTANITQTVTLVGSRIEYAYLIAALITAVFSSTFYWFQYKGVPHGAYVEDLVTKPKKDPDVKGCKRYMNLVDPATCADGKRFMGFILFLLLFLYFFQAVAGERMYSKFIRNFGLDQLGMSSSEATYLNSSFWISFSIGRFLGFFVAIFVPIRFLIISECFAGLGFATLLNFLGHNNKLAVWILTQPMSVLIAPMYPSGVAWGDHYLIMSGIGMTVLIAGGSLGAVAYIWILGYLYPRYGPRTFLYMLEVYSVSACICVCLLSVAGCLHGDRFKKMRMEEEFESEQSDQSKVKYSSPAEL